MRCSHSSSWEIGRALSDGKRADDARLALRDHETRDGDDEQRRADHRQAQAVSQDGAAAWFLGSLQAARICHETCAARQSAASAHAGAVSHAHEERAVSRRAKAGSSS